jgi:hypothetical protein
MSRIRNTETWIVPTYLTISDYILRPHTSPYTVHANVYQQFPSSMFGCWYIWTDTHKTEEEAKFVQLYV